MQLKFYLIRNTESYGSGSYNLATYKPMRNSHYDRFECSDGTFVGQLEVGCWWFHPRTKLVNGHFQYSECNYHEPVSNENAKKLLGEKELCYGELIDLTTGERMFLTEAEDVTNRKNSL